MRHTRPRQNPSSTQPGRGEGPARLDRRSFFDEAGRLAVGALAASTVVDLLHAAEPPAMQTASPAHAPSAGVVERMRTGFTFQMSVDVATIDQGLVVAAAATAAGITILEMGTPLLKSAGVANVVPAFRKRFPEALLLADMKTMDGGGAEARGVYAGGGNIIDFLAMAGVDTAKAICAVRDEFRRSSPATPRLVFADILVPHQGPAATAIDVALRMIDAGVDGIGIHLQSDARRATPSLIESDYLVDVARTLFDRIGKVSPVQVVGGLSIAQARRLAQAGVRAFVISGNLGLPDTVARYNLPPVEIQRLVAAFIADISTPEVRRQQ